MLWNFDIVEAAGRICGENQLSERANRAQQGRKDIGHQSSGKSKSQYSQMKTWATKASQPQAPLGRGGIEV
jgi:hypothetical protein